MRARLLKLSVHSPMPGYKITRLRNNWDCNRLSFISLHLLNLIMGMNVQFSQPLSVSRLWWHFVAILCQSSDRVRRVKCGNLS